MLESEEAGQRGREAAAARSSVLAIPERDVATLLVTGRDRVTWLNGLVTCDLVKRGEGEAKYGLFVARNGRVLVDAVLVVDGERALVAVPAALVDALRTHLDHYLVMEDAEMAPATDAFSSWALHGPRSAEVLAAALAAGAAGGTLDRTGLGGAAVLAPAARSAEVRAAIETAIAGVQGAIGGDDAWDILRLERGVPRFGVDFDDKTYPQEAGLEKVAVSFDKGCYLGQEIVCMLEMRGHVKRKLSSLVLASGSPPAPRSTVKDAEGADVGEVTSAVASPTLGSAIALAMVKRAHSQPGAVVAVDGVRGEVVDRPA